MATKGHKSRNRIKILKTSVVGRCLVSDTFFTCWWPTMISLIGHGGGHLSPAWPIRNSPGTFWPASLGKILALSQGMRIWACLCPYSCSLACVPIRLKWTRANNVSESLDVLKLIAPSDFGYPTQQILLSLKRKFKVPWAATGLLCRADGWRWPRESPRRKWCSSALTRS